MRVAALFLLAAVAAIALGLLAIAGAQEAAEGPAYEAGRARSGSGDRSAGAGPALGLVAGGNRVQRRSRADDGRDLEGGGDAVFRHGVPHRRRALPHRAPRDRRPAAVRRAAARRSRPPGDGARVGPGRRHGAAGSCAPRRRFGHPGGRAARSAPRRRRIAGPLGRLPDGRAADRLLRRGDQPGLGGRDPDDRVRGRREQRRPDVR